MDGSMFRAQPKQPDRPVAGVLLNSASFAAASGGDALVKLAVAALPVPQAIALRSFFLLALFSPLFVLTARKGLPVLSTRRPWLHLARALLHFAATVAAFAALQRLPLTTFTAIVFTAPVFIALSAIPILGERVKAHQWIAIALGFAGCFVILRPAGESGDTLYLIYAIISTLTWALSVALLRLLTRTESLVTLIAWGNIPPCIIAGVVALFDWRPVDERLLLITLGTAAAQLMGQWLSMTALRLAPAATVAPAQYTQILWAALFGALMFSEWPQPTIWLGASLIIAGGYWLMRSERNV